MAAIAEDMPPGDREFTHRIGWTDLDADGQQEAVVMLVGDDWCGSGGCTVFVVDHPGVAWKVASWIPTSRPPISVLDSATNGWRDMVVTEVGGGLLESRRTVLKFEKGGYVKHPELESRGHQEVLIPSF